ncbi:MAG: hypothetical protein M3416_06070 [Acidobacteriota bacterium]|nr:hypothetical protein [Acidobacteriota bacterium]
MATITLETTTYRDAGEIFDLLRGFETCALPRGRWTHAAHLTVALWYLLQYDWPEAVARVRAGIKRLNEAHGVVTTRERGYHETLTLFWLRHVRAFLERDYNEARPLVPLANELIERSGKGLPLEHYTRELLFSWEARLGWVEPDIKPFE